MSLNDLLSDQVTDASHNLTAVQCSAVRGGWCKYHSEGGGECSLKKTSKGFIHQPTNHTPSLIFWGNKMIKEGNFMTKRKIVISNQNTKSFSYWMFFLSFFFLARENLCENLVLSIKELVRKTFFFFSFRFFKFACLKMWKSSFEHQRISPKWDKVQTRFPTGKN